jgi:hypothetical protein
MKGGVIFNYGARVWLESCKTWFSMSSWEISEEIEHMGKGCHYVEKAAADHVSFVGSCLS